MRVDTEGMQCQVLHWIPAANCGFYFTELMFSIRAHIIINRKMYKVLWSLLKPLVSTNIISYLKICRLKYCTDFHNFVRMDYFPKKHYMYSQCIFLSKTKKPRLVKQIEYPLMYHLHVSYYYSMGSLVKVFIIKKSICESAYICLISFWVVPYRNVHII
jgi:hypothetical protein